MTTTTTQADRIRLTITVTPEVHQAFTRLADASGISLGRAMGDWLEDTLDAARFTAGKIEEARQAPRLVAREMHAYAMGLADETGALLDQVRAKGRGLSAPSKPEAPATTAAPPSPRPVIRGGNPSRGKGAAR